MSSTATGAAAGATLYVIGLGPGDPELMTIKAERVIRRAAVIAFFAKTGGLGQARSIVAGLLSPRCEELRFDYPFTTEVALEEPRYRREMRAFYDASAARIAEKLDAGIEVALLCEGDPFFYGSAMYLFDRLASRYRTVVVPGITALSGCAARARMPITRGNEVLSVLPATLDEAHLTRHLQRSDAAVVMKVGRQLGKVRRVIERTGKLDRAVYVEHGTQPSESISPLGSTDATEAPYFSLILVPRDAPR